MTWVSPTAETSDTWRKGDNVYFEHTHTLFNYTGYGDDPPLTSCEGTGTWVQSVSTDKVFDVSSDEYIEITASATTDSGSTGLVVRGYIDGSETNYIPMLLLHNGLSDSEKPETPYEINPAGSADSHSMAVCVSGVNTLRLEFWVTGTSTSNVGADVASIAKPLSKSENAPVVLTE